MTAWQSPGDVIRWWRSEVLGLTQQEAAERLNVRPSAVSNWERGTRAISIELADLDEGLKAEGVLEGLLWGHGTAAGLEPGHRWTKVFPGPSRPVWMWLRSPSERVAMIGEWGVTRLEVELDLGPNGVFITVGASIADSPVVVHVSEPSWADFGRGELPVNVPGAPIITAVEIFERSSANGPFMDLFRSDLAAKLNSRSQQALNLADIAPGAVVSYMSGGEGPRRDGMQSNEAVSEGVDEVLRNRFATLRKARGLSLSAMAELLAKRTGIEIGRDTLRRFETDVGRPHDPVLPVALDHALGAGGRLAVLTVQTGRGSGAAVFPPYWRGPVWLQLEDDRGHGQVVLRRGNWQREYSFDRPSLVSAHWFDPSLPLRVRVEETTRWAAGVGRRPGAVAIDQNWVPISMDVAQQAVADAEEAIFTAMDRRPDQ